MLDALYKHGLVGGSGGATLTEQIEKNYIVAAGETITKGDPVFLDGVGSLRKVKASERGLNERKIGTTRDMASYIQTDNYYSQLVFIPNNYETRFAVLEATPLGRAELRICGIRNKEVVILATYEFSNRYQVNSQLGNFRMGFNPYTSCLYVCYENWSTTTRNYISIYKFAFTHTDSSCTMAPSVLDMSSYTSSTNSNSLGGMIFQKDGSIVVHGFYYSASYLDYYWYITAAFVSSTVSTGFFGINNSVPFYVASDYSIASPAYNVGLIYYADVPKLQYFNAANSYPYPFTLVAGTHFVGSIAQGVTKRFRNTEDRYVSVYTTDPYNREYRLGILVYTFTGTAFTINTIQLMKNRYNITIYNSWLLKENKLMVLAYDNSLVKFRLFIIDIDNTTNVATITKEIVLNGNGRIFHGADYYNGVLIISTSENQHGIIRSYYVDVDSNSVREHLNHGIANQNGVAADSIKVVLKGKVQGLSGLTKDKDYYAQRDGTLGVDNRGNHAAYADSDNTLIIDVPFYEKEAVTII